MTPELSALSAGVGALNLRKQMRRITEAFNPFTDIGKRMAEIKYPNLRVLELKKQQEQIPSVPPQVPIQSPKEKAMASNSGSSYFNAARNKNYKAQLDAALGK